MDSKKPLSSVGTSLPMPASSSTWARVRDEYLEDASPEEKKFLQSSSLEKVQEDIEKLDRTHHDNSKMRRLGETFKPLLTGLRMFGTAIDLIAQSEPNGALIWGSIRLVLALFERFINVFDELSESLAKLGGPLGRLEEYLKIYGTSARFSTAVEKVYEAYLRCMKYTQQFLRKGRDRSFIEKLGDAANKTKIWLTFESGLQAKIKDVRDLCDDAKEEAQLAGAQVSQDFFQRQDVQAEKLERKAIEEWLSPLQFLARQRDMLTIKDFSDAGGWLFDSEAFKYWSEGKPQLLQCYGSPGAGKTVFSAIIAEHLKQKFGPQNVEVICLFLEHREAKNHTLNNLFGSLLKQLVQLSNTNGVPGDLKYAYDRAMKLGGLHPEKQQVSRAFKKALEKYERVYLLVDGLDQCEFRIELLDELCDLDPERLSILVTQRLIDREAPTDRTECQTCGKMDAQVYWRCPICNDGNYDICQECKDEGETCEDGRHFLEGPQNHELDVDARDEDLRRYVRAVITKEAGHGSRPYDPRRHRAQTGKTTFGRQCLQDKTLLDRIPDIVVDNAEGRFLYAKLYLDLLKTRSSPREIQDLLDAPPTGLDSFYEDALKRICALKNDTARSIGLRSLYLLVTAQRPLSLEELRHALAVKPDDQTLDRYDMCDMEFILENTMGLITIDSDFGSVHMHLTLQKYLMQTGDKWYPDAEREMARICLAYLSFEGVLPYVDDEIDDKKTDFPFMAYAATFWGTHVYNVATDPQIRAAALNLVKDPDKVEACVRVAWRTDRSTDSWDVRRGLHGIHVCAWFGLSEVIAAIETRREDVNLQEPTYRQTALMYACRKGHIEVVRELLDLGADLNIKSRRGRTAIFEAVTHHQTEIVDLLLKEPSLKLDNEYVQDSDHTELWIAADRGYDDIAIKLAADPRVDVNKVDRYGRSAIWIAIFKGHLSIVSEILQQRPDADVNLADNMGGRTPLILAARSNQPETVELLLSHGAEPEQTDLDGGGTALLRAVENNAESAMEVLIDHNANTQCRDHDGRGLLHGGCGQGWDNITLTLLDKCKLDIDMTDNHGMTPLHEACQNNHSGAAQLLLEKGAEKAPKDKYGRTPLQVACQHDCRPVMDLLENQYLIKPDFIKSEDHLPPWSLARSGRLDVIKAQFNSRKGSPAKLQEQLSICEPRSKYTCLHYAVENDQVEVLRYLLKEYKAHPDPINKFKRTPLHLAANSGMLKAVKILLAHDADPTKTDAWGVTPLYLAQYNRFWEIAITLIEKDDDTIDEKINVQALFFEAVRLGRVEAVNILLAHGADILLSDKRGYTGLQIAETAEEPNEKLIQLLRKARTRFVEKEAEMDEEETEETTKQELQSTPIIPFRSRPTELRLGEPEAAQPADSATQKTSGFQDEGIDLSNPPVAHKASETKYQGNSVEEPENISRKIQERVPVLA